MSTNTIQPGFTLPAAAGQATVAAPAPSGTFGELLSAFTGSQGQSGKQPGNPAGLVAEPAQGEAAVAAPAQVPAPAFPGQQALLPVAVSVNVQSPARAVEQVAKDVEAKENTSSGHEALPVIDTAAAIPAAPSADTQQAPAFQMFMAAAPAAFTPAEAVTPTGSATVAIPAPASLRPQTPAAQAPTLTGALPAVAAAPAATAEGSFSPVAGTLQKTASAAEPPRTKTETPAQPLMNPAPAGGQGKAPATAVGPAAPLGAPSAPIPVQQAPQLQIPQALDQTFQSLQGGAVQAGTTVDPAPPSVPEASPDRPDAFSAPITLAGTTEALKQASPAAPAASAAAPLPQQPMAAQLARPLFTLATEAPGEHVMTMKVSPEDLGPVTVRAHISSDGVRLELFAAGDAGRDAVRTALPELRRELAQQGLTATLDLSGRDTPGQGQAMGQQHRGNHDQRGPYQASLRMVTEAEPASGQTVRPLSSTAGLDVVA